jgi:hypothetical protein
MAHLICMVRGLAALEGTDVVWQCFGRTSDMTNQDPDEFWDSEPIVPGTNGPEMARAIVRAGIAHMATKGRTVGAGDEKIVVGVPTTVTGV